MDAILPQLSEELTDRVRVRYPLPVADAVHALLSCDNAHQYRDRVVEVFRAGLRFLAAVALAARVQFGAGAAGDGPEVERLLRKLRRQGLTDGEWAGLLRELLWPHVGQASSHAVPELVALCHGGPEFPRVVDALLRMRGRQTVAHGQTGEPEDVAAVLAARVPQLEQFLALQGPLWERLRLAVPLAAEGGAARAQRAWRLSGTTPPGGRWERLALVPDVALVAGQPVLATTGGRPALALHPLACVRRPSPEAIEEVFLLDGGGAGARARYLAFPSGAQHQDDEVWEALARCLGPQAEDPRAGEGPGGTTRPYRGLESFGREHAGLFFGREREAEALANRIRAEALLTVTGASASGKTSLLQAGVRPLLPDWGWLVVRPGATPLETLGARLAAELAAWPAAAALPECARERPAALGPTLRRWARETGERLVLLVDQAEELFTLCLRPDERQAFAEALAGVASDADAPLRVVVVLREDFFGRLAPLTALRERCARHVQLVVAPDREALAATLVRPAQAFGYRFEDDSLALAMVDAVAGRPAALALLQFCADRLWESRDRTWKRLTWDAYRALGGVAGALATHADRTLAGLTAAQRAVTRALLLRLVTEEGTRAAAARGELVGAAGDSGDAEAVLDRLVAERLLVVREDESGGDGDSARVELAHEALIDGWPQLRRWRDEDAEGLRFATRLRQAAAAWDEGGRSPDLLWRGASLAALAERRRAGLSLALREQHFADASLRAARRRTWTAAGVVGLVLLLLALATVLTFGAWQSAERSRHAEAQGRARAEANERQAQTTLAWAFADRASRAAADRDYLSARVFAAAGLRESPENPFGPNRAGAATATGDVSPQVAALYSGLFPALVEPLLRYRATLTTHTGTTYRVALSPDGRRVAAACWDATARLWDVRDGRSTATIVGHEGPLSGVAFSADGALLYTSSEDATIRSWSVPDGAPRTVLRGHTGTVMSIALSPDGALLASGGGDRTLRLWSVSDERPAATLEGHEGGIVDVAWSPDGTLLASASYDGTARLWDVARAAEVGVLRGHEGPLYGVDVSPDGRLVATAGVDGAVGIWDVAGRARVATLTGHTSWVRCVRFLPEGDLLFSGSWDGSVRLWNVAARRAIAVSQLHRGIPTGLAVSRAGDVLAVSEAYMTVRLWDLNLRPPAVRLRGHRADVRWVAFSPDGRLVASAGHDGAVRLWDVERRATVTELAGHHAGFAGGVTFSPDGKLLATVEADGLAQLWTVPDGQLRATCEGHVGLLTTVAFSPDGALFATAGADRGIRLWRTADGAPVGVLTGHTALVWSVQFSPDGRTVVSGGRDGRIRLWDVATRTQRAEFDARETMVLALALAPDGRTLLSGGDGGPVRVWDLGAGGRPVRELAAHVGGVVGLALSPDGRLALSGGNDSTAHLWDVPSGRRLLTLHLVGQVRAVAFAPDGQRFAVADGADVVVYPLRLADWQRPPADLLREAEAAAGVELRGTTLHDR